MSTYKIYFDSNITIHQLKQYLSQYTSSIIIQFSSPTPSLTLTTTNPNFLSDFSFLNPILISPD